MVEEFKKIDGFERYSVSNFGNIRNDLTGRIMKLKINSEGYYKLNLRTSEKKPKSQTKTVHRLVALAFIPNPDNKPFIDHVDNNQLNNHTSNLRWATPAENSYNMKISKNNTSGYKGVRFNSRDKKWVAKIRHKGKSIHIGSYEFKEDSIKARVLKAEELFGEFKNRCEVIKEKRIQLDEELEALERELEELINN